MRLQCSVKLSKLLAVLNGQKWTSRAVKGVVQLINNPGGLVQILVSTNKDVNGRRYNVSNIQNLWTRFISEGMLTIEMDVNRMIMISNCDPEELVKFHSQLVEYIKSPVNVSSVVGENSQLAAGHNDEASQLAPSSRNNLGSNPPVKRKHEEMSISEMDVSTLKKTRPVPKTLNCHAGKKCPKVFPPLVERVLIRNIQLKEIDPRILPLSNLETLDLSCNCITSIEPLRRLKSSLVKLVLSNNEIEVIPDDLFLAKPFENLISLQLNENKLKMLPSSILQLRNLSTLDVSRNQLEVLPYHLNKLQNLLTLKVNANRLEFVPFTVCALKLSELDVSDNCFKNINSNNNARKSNSKFSKKNPKKSDFPTLFELAIETISTLNFSRNRVVIPEETPKIIKDNFSACKWCGHCNRMRLRCTTIVNDNVMNGGGAKTTTYPVGFRSFPSQKFVCSKCVMSIYK